MKDYKDLTIEVNSTTELVSLPVAYENLYKVSVDGIGLRIREPDIVDLIGQDIGSFQYRAKNPGAPLQPGSTFMVASSFYYSGLIYWTLIRVGSSVNVGYKYTLTMLGVTVSYVATDTDTDATVVDEFVTLINSTTYPSPVNAAVFTIGAIPHLRVQTVGATPISLSIEPGDFWMSKSGLYWGYNGNYYIIVENRVESDDIPAIPPVDTSYAYGDMTNIGSNFLAYLAEPEYPTVDYSNFVGFYDIAEVTGVPDDNVILGPNDVIPLPGFILNFGTAFNEGFIQKLSILYA